MNMISNVNTRQDVWDILCITSLQPQAWNAWFWRRQPCWHSSENRWRQMQEMPWWLPSVCLMEGIMLFIFLHRKMILWKNICGCEMTTRKRSRRLSNRSMHCAFAMGIITKEPRGQSSMSHGWENWNCRHCTGKLWMNNIWLLSMSRQ